MMASWARHLDTRVQPHVGNMLLDVFYDRVQSKCEGERSKRVTLLDSAAATNGVLT